MNFYKRLFSGLLTTCMLFSLTNIKTFADEISDSINAMTLKCKQLKETLRSDDKNLNQLESFLQRCNTEINELISSTNKAIKTAPDGKKTIPSAKNLEEAKKNIQLYSHFMDSHIAEYLQTHNFTPKEYQEKSETVSKLLDMMCKTELNLSLELMALLHEVEKSIPVEDSAILKRLADPFSKKLSENYHVSAEKVPLKKISALNLDTVKKQRQKSISGRLGTLTSDSVKLNDIPVVDENKFIYSQYNSAAALEIRYLKMERKFEEVLFNFEPCSDDIYQGDLGNCFFLTALGSIVERSPEYIKNCIIDNQDGTVTIRFYDDTQNPYYYRILKSVPNGLVTNDKNYLWVKLFEKAYTVHIFNLCSKKFFSAQNHEVYDYINIDDGGEVHKAMTHICGGLEHGKLGDYLLSSCIHYYQPLIPAIHYSKNEVGKYSSEVIKFFQNEVRNKLRSGYALSASNYNYSRDGQKQGIYDFHAYSIIGFEENVELNTGEKLNLLILRNPHGTDVPRYQEMPSTGDCILSNTPYSESSSGEFKMDLNDFLRIFTHISYCKLPAIEVAKPPIPAVTPPAELLVPIAIPKPVIINALPTVKINGQDFLTNFSHIIPGKRDMKVEKKETGPNITFTVTEEEPKGESKIAYEFRWRRSDMPYTYWENMPPDDVGNNWGVIKGIGPEKEAIWNTSKIDKNNSYTVFVVRLKYGQVDHACQFNGIKIL